MVGILTFSKANNLGAVLQAYALQKFLQNNNIDASHIDFSFKRKQTANLQKPQSFLGRMKASFDIVSRYNNRKTRINFADFRTKYINFFPEKQIDAIRFNDDPFDIYIVGSDQVWNTDLNGANSSFYLDFTKHKKLAYSASVGRSLTRLDKSLLLKYADGFDAISAREQDLCDYLCDSDIKSIVTVDPVFLLSKNQWESIERRVRVPKKYIFVYTMQGSPVMKESLAVLSKKLKAKIVWYNGGGEAITDLPGKCMKTLSPNEFLYLVNHSQAVVTNSFHGASFASLFQKPLLIVSHTTRNERLVTLCRHISDSDKILYSSEDIVDIDHKIIYPDENHIMNLIDESKAFLLKNIKGDPEL